MRFFFLTVVGGWGALVVLLAFALFIKSSMEDLSAIEMRLTPSSSFMLVITFVARRALVNDLNAQSVW